MFAFMLCVFLCICVYVCVFMCVRARVRVCVCMCMCMCMCMCICVCVCVCVCMCKYYRRHAPQGQVLIPLYFLPPCSLYHLIEFSQNHKNTPQHTPFKHMFKRSISGFQGAGSRGRHRSMGMLEEWIHTHTHTHTHVRTHARAHTHTYTHTQ